MDSRAQKAGKHSTSNPRPHRQLAPPHVIHKTKHHRAGLCCDCDAVGRRPCCRWSTAGCRLGQGVLERAQLCGSQPYLARTLARSTNKRISHMHQLLSSSWHRVEADRRETMGVSGKDMLAWRTFISFF